MKQTVLNQREIVFLLSALIAASVLLFTNLGNIYLWQDEAQTALISKTVLQYGVPKGYDEKNYFSQELGAEYGDNHIWKWHAWLPFYLLAGFFKVFGTTTFVARLPFAMFGVGCIILIYFFSRSLWEDKRVAVLSVAVLLLCVPFLILARQCRYYSLLSFFSIWGLYGYHAMIRGKSFGSISYMIASTLLFHTHFLYCATLIGTVVLHTLVFYRNQWKKVVLWSIGIIAVNSPWIIWFSGMQYPGQYASAVLKWSPFIGRLHGFLVHIQQNVFPVFLLLIPLLLIVWRWFKKNTIFSKSGLKAVDGTSLIIMFISLNLFALSLVAPDSFFRYLSPLLPPIAMLVGLFLSWAITIHFLLGIAFFTALIFSGSLKNFLYEITHDYNGPIEGIVLYLNAHAKKNDIVAITYGDLPVKFYTGLRVFGGLTGEDLKSCTDADWVIIRRRIICEKDFQVQSFLVNNIQWKHYSKIRLDYPDIPFENRESPEDHLYKTKVDDFPVFIFKKTK